MVSLVRGFFEFGNSSERTFTYNFSDTISNIRHFIPYITMNGKSEISNKRHLKIALDVSTSFFKNYVKKNTSFYIPFHLHYCLLIWFLTVRASSYAPWFLKCIQCCFFEPSALARSLILTDSGALLNQCTSSSTLLTWSF